MAFTKADLLAFNAAETTDIVNGALELPYIKPLTYIPGVTYSTAHESFIRGNGGMGSQVVIRKLGKATAAQAKATASGGLDYTAAQTADDVRIIPIDDVHKWSEKVYEPVEVARQSASGAAKAELTLDIVLESAQSKFTYYLQTTALASVDTTKPDAENALGIIIAEMQKLDYQPDTLAVSKTFYGVLLQMITAGHFRANPREEVVRTGILGEILGLNVVIDYNFNTTNFIVYNKDHYPAFTLFEDFSLKDAHTFPGTLVNAMLITGGGGELYQTKDIGTGKGIWGVKHQGQTPPSE